jgi:hypothetical protein
MKLAGLPRMNIKMRMATTKHKGITIAAKIDERSVFFSMMVI